MSNSDAEWIAAIVDGWAELEPFPQEVKTAESGLELDDGGIPLDMVFGPIVSGEARWTTIPSTVTEAEVVAFEHLLGGPLPPLFHLYLTCRHHLVQHLFGDPVLLWPTLPSDAQLLRLSSLVEGNAVLVRHGYAPFAQYAEGYGVLSFDLRRRTADGECPVVGHEIDRIDADLRGGDPGRADLERLATLYHPSARAFFASRQAGRPPR